MLTYPSLLPLQTARAQRAEAAGALRALRSRAATAPGEEAALRAAVEALSAALPPGAAVCAVALQPEDIAPSSPPPAPLPPRHMVCRGGAPPVGALVDWVAATAAARPGGVVLLEPCCVGAVTIGSSASCCAGRGNDSRLVSSLTPE